MLLGNPRDHSHIYYIQQRIGERLYPYHSCVGLHGSFNLSLSSIPTEVNSMPSSSSHPQTSICTTIKVFLVITWSPCLSRCMTVVSAAIPVAKAKPPCLLKGGDGILQSLSGRIRCAGIIVALCFAYILEDKGRRLIDGCYNSAGCRARAASRMDCRCFKSHDSLLCGRPDCFRTLRTPVAQWND